MIELTLMSVSPTAARLRTAFLLALAASLIVATAPARADDRAGAYRLAGTALVRASPLLDERMDAELTIRVAEAGPAGRLTLLVSYRGYPCELQATAEGADALAFASGQTCTFQLDEEKARGPVKAHLRKGRGRLGGGTLALELAWKMDGELKLKGGGQQVEVLGRVIALPSAWEPAVRVEGTVDYRGEGARETSPTANEKAGAPEGAPARTGAR